MAIFGSVKDWAEHVRVSATHGGELDRLRGKRNRTAWAESSPTGGVSRDFGKLQVVGEVGYEVMRSAENEWVLGILGALAVSERLELLSEVHITGPKLFSESDVILNFGFRQELTPHLKLLASAGTGVNNGPNRTSFIAYLGIQVLFGEEKH